MEYILCDYIYIFTITSLLRSVLFIILRVPVYTFEIVSKIIVAFKNTRHTKIAQIETRLTDYGIEICFSFRENMICPFQKVFYQIVFIC